LYLIDNIKFKNIVQLNVRAYWTLSDWLCFWIHKIIGRVQQTQLLRNGFVSACCY